MAINRLSNEALTYSSFDYSFHAEISFQFSMVGRGLVVRKFGVKGCVIMLVHFALNLRCTLHYSFYASKVKIKPIPLREVYFTIRLPT